MTFKYKSEQCIIDGVPNIKWCIISACGNRFYADTQYNALNMFLDYVQKFE